MNWTFLRSGLLGTVAIATLLAIPARAVAEHPAATNAPAAVQSRPRGRDALRAAIWELERSLRERLRATEGGAANRAHGIAPRSADEDRELLAVMRRDGKKLGGAGAELLHKAAALRPLLAEVERRETATGTAAAPSSAWEPDALSRRLDVTAASSCGDAVPVGDGRFAANLTASHGSSELWLSYTAPSSGMAAVSTAGSDFDTAIEVYDRCPAGGATPLARGDDELGLQARAGFAVTADQTKWIRISGWEGAIGEALVTTASGLSGFAGVISREDDGQPVNRREVEVWTSAGAYAGSTEPDNNGVYSFVGIAPGTYFASTAPNYYRDFEGLLDELYDNVPCAGGAPDGCSPTSGTPIIVPADAILNDIDFALGAGAVLTGRVRESATGLALQSVRVEVFGSTGTFIADADTDIAGRYTISGLGNGTVYARAADQGYGSQYGRELYRDIPCGSNACSVTTGTPISMSVGSTTSGIDFNLDKLGAIEGTVTRVQDGSGVAYAAIRIWDSHGNLTSYYWNTDYEGHYSVNGLDPGTYFVSTASGGELMDELYDNLPCDPSCTPTAGAPIVVTSGSTRSGIDFALRRMGSISGALRDAATGAAITNPYTSIYVYNPAGTIVAYGYNDGLGTYTAFGIPSGTYYVFAGTDYYRPELYNDVPCQGGPPTGCSLSAGTAVSVQLDANTGGVDFALTRLGSISGTVIDQTTGAPVDEAVVRVWNAAAQIIAYQYSPGGVYKVEGIPSGTYYVTATRYDYATELYSGLPCPGDVPPNCNPASGTPVSVSLGATTSGVNFTLVRLGGIAGTVRDATSGNPIDSAYVDVFNAAGSWIASTYTTGGGKYQFLGLEAGNHFVTARAYAHSGRLYSGLPCPSSGCSPTSGTPVAVTLGATASSIDFNLPGLGTITGLVTANGGLVGSVNVNLYAANGNWGAFGYTGSDGRYSIATEEGTWFVAAGTTTSFYSGVLYPDIPCPGGSCNVSTGTPVSVVANGTTSGIDFKLGPGRGILGCVRGGAAQPLAQVAMDLWSQAGAHVETVLTGVDGCYRFLPGNSGTYFVSTDSGLGLEDELWNSVPCPLGSAYAGGCDPTTGTPINVPSPFALVTGIDFVLGVGHIYVSGFEAGVLGWSASWPP